MPIGKNSLYLNNMGLGLQGLFEHARHTLHPPVMLVRNILIYEDSIYNLICEDSIYPKI